MLVTGATQAEKLDKLEQVFYRVRDARWTAGSFTFHINDTEGSGEEWDTIIEIPAVEPTERLLATRDDVDFTEQTARGYVSFARDGFFNPPTLNGAPSGSFGETYTAAGEGYYDFSAADAASEYAIWWTPYQSATGDFSFLDPGVFRTGYFFYSNFATDMESPSLYVFTEFSDANDEYPYFFCEALLHIHDTIAFVDNDESGDPFSPANDMYLRPEFSVEGSTIRITTIAADLDPAGCDLVLELSGDKTLRCPLYFGDSLFLVSSFSGTDFVLTATKWWPYGASGDERWDSTTGEPINGGPGA
jgi:hypothetical protein